MKSAILLLYAASIICAEVTAAVPVASQNYVSRPEPDVAWKWIGTIETKAGRVHQLRVTSHEWRDIIWRHAVEVYEPMNLTFSRRR